MSVASIRAWHGSSSSIPGSMENRDVWIADLLPEDLADLVDGMMDQGCAAMRRTLEADNGDDEGIN